MTDYEILRQQLEKQRLLAQYQDFQRYSDPNRMSGDEALTQEARNAYQNGLLDYQSQIDSMSGVGGVDSNLLRQAIGSGQVGLLNELYGDKYSDQLSLLSDLGIGIGQRGGKDDTIILPASPVGDSGGWQFDPVYGSDKYKTYAESLGSQLGMTPEQVAQAAGQYALTALYDPAGRQAFIGDNGAPAFNRGLAESILNASGQQLDENSRNAYLSDAERYAKDVASQLYSEGNSSGFGGIPKGVWKDAATVAAFVGGGAALANAAGLGATGAAGGSGAVATSTPATLPTATGTALTGSEAAFLEAGKQFAGQTALAVPGFSGAGGTALLNSTLGMTAPAATAADFMNASNVSNPTTNPTLPGFSGDGGANLLDKAISAPSGLTASQALKGLNTANKLMGGLGVMQAGMSGATGIPYKDVQYNKYQFNPNMYEAPTDYTRYGTRPEHKFVDWNIQSLLA